MTKSDQIVLQLVRKALNAEYLVDSSMFKDACWAKVIDVATTQGVLGICFDAIEALKKSVSKGFKVSEVSGGFPDKGSLMVWLGRVLYMEKCYEVHAKAVKELASFYDGQGIRMMLLKGYGLSRYYPVPNHRPIGDIDIYLYEEFQKVSGVSKASGGEPVWKRADRLITEKLGIEVESGHEHHTTFNYKGIMVENHYDFINVKAHKDAPAIEARLKELASMGERKVLIGSNGSEVQLPSADFNAIFLIRHLGQHFAGEHVTLRQLLDWGVFLQHSCGKDGSECVHWDEIVPFLKKMGIWTFFNQINAVCEDYLGIKLPDGVPSIERKPDLEKRIIEDILHPEFDEKKPQKLIPVLWFKAKRWWFNRWKHPLIYNEWWLPMLLTLAWSHLRRIETIKD